MSVRSTIRIHEGEPKTLTFTVEEGDNPLDLTGKTVEWVLTRAPADAPIVTKATGSGLTVTDEQGGVFEVDLAAADTEDRPPLLYHEGKVDGDVVVYGDVIVRARAS